MGWLQGKIGFWNSTRRSASGTYAIAGTGTHQLSHIAPAECVTFALCGEQAQLLALLIRQ